MVSFFSTYAPGMVAGAVALVAGVVLVLSKGLHGKYSLDHQEGVQKMHSTPTPRIGGLAIAAGLAVAWALASGELRGWLGLIGLAGLPALGFGLAEDITSRVAVKWRLMATIFSGAVFCLASGQAIGAVGVPGADTLLAIYPVAVAFSAFSVGGVANSVNLIDGFHGLASGTLLIIFATFAFVFARLGDETMVSLSITLLLVVLGFFLVNFPAGKLFLGDAGAYFAGYMVAVLGVLLPTRHPEVSPWVSVLILGYPVIETLFSILRRRWDGHSPGAPDSAHLHHLVHRRWALPLAQRLGVAAAAGNPLTSLLLWSLPLGTFAATAALSSLGATPAALVVGGAVMVYLLIYRLAASGPKPERGSGSPR